MFELVKNRWMSFKEHLSNQKLLKNECVRTLLRGDHNILKEYHSVFIWAFSTSQKYIHVPKRPYKGPLMKEKIFDMKDRRRQPSTLQDPNPRPRDLDVSTLPRDIFDIVLQT